MSKSIFAASAVALGLAMFTGPASAAADGNQGSAKAAAVSAAAGQCKGCFAVVNANGTLARGKGVLSVTKLVGDGPGVYDVRFTRPITRCAFTSTIGLSAFSGSETPGETTVVGRVGTNNGVFAETLTSAGVNADRGFHLVITCP